MQPYLQHWGQGWVSQHMKDTELSESVQRGAMKTVKGDPYACLQLIIFYDPISPPSMLKFSITHTCQKMTDQVAPLWFWKIHSVHNAYLKTNKQKIPLS